MSINSTKDYAKKIIDNIKSTTCPDLVAGGHDDRSGGTINSSDAKVCSDWVELFKNSAKKFCNLVRYLIDLTVLFV